MLLNKKFNIYEEINNLCKTYYYKLTNGKCVLLIEAPALYDKSTDLEKLKSSILKEKIDIKGILFLTNFQSVRLDSVEQETLLSYYKAFPIKNFWTNLIYIYTHCYAAPDEDMDMEEMKNERRNSIKQILSLLMKKVENVSNDVSYNDLKIKYFNSYSYANNDKKKKNNCRIKEELEELFNEFIKNNFLFYKC